VSGKVVYFERFRRAANRPRACRGDEPPQSPFRGSDERPRRALSDRQIAHRRRMLDRLTNRPASGVSTSPGSDRI